MLKRYLAGLLVAATLYLSTALPSDLLEADRAALRGAGVADNGAALLRFFRTRTVDEPLRRRIAGLIERLGSEEFVVREQATRDLQTLGAPTRSQLTQALNHPDLEIRRRCRRLLDQLGSSAAELALYAPAARLLAQARPPEAIRTLLEFLPSVEDPAVVEETASALAGLAVGENGKVEGELLATLRDPQPVRRLAGGLALAGVPAVRPAVLRLLNDPNLRVRRAVAVALLRQQERRAVPTLIDLLRADERGEAAEAETALLPLAGENAPDPPVKETADTLTTYCKQWHAWWKQNEARIDLAKVDFEGAGNGLTLVVTLQRGVVAKAGGLQGCIIEFDRQQKERWRIEDLVYPIHAHKFRRDRLLVCEYTQTRVTERDLTGRIYWEYKAPFQIISAERLRNGNTLVVSRNQIIEVDREGSTVRTIGTGLTVSTCHRHADGRFSVLTTTGTLVQLDRDGKQEGSVVLPGLRPYASIGGFRAQFLPGGGVLVPDYFQNKIREYDATGKVVWEVNYTRPTGVIRQRNGHVLVYSRVGAGGIVEIDREGRVVNNRATGGPTLFVDQR